MELESLANLPSEDVAFLNMKGCLHLPDKPILNELVRQYFLHVHPMLPVLSESDFWAGFNNDAAQAGKGIVSLFVLQAMLAASCVVSLAVSPFDTQTI